MGIDFIDYHRKFERIAPHTDYALLPATERQFVRTVAGELRLTQQELRQVSEIAGLEVDATRVRLTLEGSQTHPLADGGLFEPSLEIGGRYDGGGAEIGGGRTYRAGTGRLAGVLQHRTAPPGIGPALSDTCPSSSINQPACQMLWTYTWNCICRANPLSCLRESARQLLRPSRDGEESPGSIG